MLRARHYRSPRVFTAGIIFAAFEMLAAAMLIGHRPLLVNFYLVVPAAGWTWFPERTDPVVQFLAHGFFFGCTAGWMLDRGRPAIGPTL